jgi:hypothetical protein
MLRDHGGGAGTQTPNPRLGGGLVKLEEIQRGVCTYGVAAVANAVEFPGAHARQAPAASRESS